MVQPSSPVIVKIVEPPHDPTGISDVIIGAIGLTGFIVLLAVLLGLTFGAVLFWLRRRSDDAGRSSSTPTPHM